MVKITSWYVVEKSIVAAAMLVVLAVAWLLALVVPFGNDTSAHLYLTWLFRHHGFSLWDNSWYFGKIQFVGYSYTYYPIAALTDVQAPAIVGLVAVSGLVVSHLPTALARSRKIIATTIISITLATLVLSGAYPFLFSLAPLSLAVLAFWKRRFIVFFFSALFSVATSPLQLITLLALVVGQLFMDAQFQVGDSEVLSLASRGRLILRSGYRSPNFKSLVSLFLIAIVYTLGQVYFGLSGSYPFYWTDLAMLLIYLALSVALAMAILSKKLRNLVIFMTVGYASFSIFSFVIPSSLGGNVSRVGEFAPTIAVVLWSLSSGWKHTLKNRLLVVLLMLYSIGWMLTYIEAPVFDPNQGVLTRSSTWTVVSNYLAKHYRDQRIEYVDSLLHEGAYFLPIAGVPIARGWFRQSDFPENKIFYQTSISAKQYKNWLCVNHIAAVVLPPAPYDYSAVREAYLIKNAQGLFRQQSVKLGLFDVYNVSGCPDTSFQINSITRSVFTVTFSKSGTFELPYMYSRFSHTTFGQIEAPRNSRLVIRVSSPGVARVRTF